MNMLVNRNHRNTQAEAATIRESGRKLALILQRHDRDTLTLQVAETHELVEVPSRAIALLANILEVMATGKDVAITPIDAELTTAEAADLLNVSRPFLVRLLDEGAIPHRKVGTHRRILLEDVLSYREKHKQSSEAILDQLVQDAQEHDMGYGQP